MTNIFCFFSIHFPDEKQNALFKVRWQSFVFIWGRFFGPFILSPRENPGDGKKQKGWWRKNILTIEWRRGALWIDRVSKCDFREDEVRFFTKNIELNFLDIMNNYEYSWKAAVLTKNTLYKNWDLSLFWHGLTALAGFCMNSSYMSAYVYLESKGITQIEGEMKKSSNFHAWSRQTNELRKSH